LKNKTVENAVKALLYEVVINPKPGLVDPTQNVCHKDMDVFTFIDSALALTSYFEQIYETAAAFTDKDLTLLFQRLRPLGMQAECEMFEATHAVNTHKGAIFSLGILVAAATYSPQNVLETTKKMLAGLTQNDFEKIDKKINLTAGEKQFLKYGLTGIRGEAEAGFPIVAEFALPFLQTSQGSRNQRLLDTLLKISEVLPDSNLIKRSGSPEILDWYREQVGAYFLAGASRTADGRHIYSLLLEEMAEKNLSLGGSADMLIITIFLALHLGLDF
jgi:triphosphoribosyl-dephospho-CoA synthase CitG